MEKLPLIIAIILLTSSAYAAYSPPPGGPGDVPYNGGNQQWGVTHLLPNSILGEVTTGTPKNIFLRNGLSITTTGGNSFLDATTTQSSSALGSSTTANPYISGDFTSGFFTPGAGRVAVESAGTKAMEWTSTSTTVPSLPLYSLTGTTTGGTLVNVHVGTNLTLTTTGGVTTLNASGSPPSELDIIEENGPIIIEENGPNIVEENSP